MREDGSLEISHDAPEEEAPVAAPITSGDAENSSTESPDASDQVAPITPAAMSDDEEPVDIFASPAEKAAETSTKPSSHMTNNPFHNRKFQASSTGAKSVANSNVPQFFNDAIIANTPVEAPRSSKKGLFVGIGIGLVALVGVGLLVFALTSKSSTPASTNPIAAKVKTDTKQSFYSYANYLLYGNESTNAIDVDSATNIDYAYLKSINPAAGIYDQSYANSLSEKFSTFADKASKDYGDDGGQLIDIINDYVDLLDFIKSNPDRKELSIETIKNTYINSGKSAAKTKASSLLSDYNIESNIYQPFYKAKQKSFESLINYLDLLSSKNCINNGAVIQTCAASIRSSSEKQEDDIRAFINYENEAKNIINRRANDLASNCLNIATILENKGDEK